MTSTNKRGATTRRLVLDDRTRTIDLVDENWEKLTKAFKRFTDKATETTPRRSAVDDVYATIDQSVIRAWAQAEGIEVNDKGKISLDLVYRWKRAQAAAASTAEIETDDAGEASATHPDGESADLAISS